MQRNKESSRQKGKQNQSRNIQGTCPQIFGWHLLCANHWNKDAEKSHNVPALREHAALREELSDALISLVALAAHSCVDLPQ